MNRFFPTLGNHDWITNHAAPYFDYFTLPGNERYYTVTQGPVELFALDSDTSEPDGVGVSSAQAAWFKDQIAKSTAPWRIVYFHHPPYSSGLHGSTSWMQWPFEAWGASAVLSGHDHTYERLQVGDIPYFVDGLGGYSIYAFQQPVPQSVVRYNSDYGALLITATSQTLNFEFMNTQGEVVDHYTETK